MKLLIDLGNSRLKSAFWDGAQLQRGSTLTHARTGEAEGGEAIPGEMDFSALWRDVPTIDAIWIASVAAGALEQALTRSLGGHFAIPVRYARSPAAACGVRNAYSAPARLGVDRFLGMVAAHHETAAPAVIASCGTALALDAVGADGRHLGGLIAPAPALMRQALLEHTARLGELTPAPIAEFADTTAAAVESGTWLAAVALVERFARRAQASFGVTPELILCGGGARSLASLLELEHRCEPDLVLRGLAHFADAEGK
ncbi:MAG: type III pantothenate kinase [Proteobacteria bacterium]|uniref:type III pantothenate kinase n=1 Tax=Rudaea sp. TaxID=2136325 RepID=UPI001DE640B4|nr:type III pantothenate kinase [Pseudomonadota bacterium]MBS0567109.1 type III pantothenate kinase [Pseudomonadota bacterium]